MKYNWSRISGPAQNFLIERQNAGPEFLDQPRTFLMKEKQLVF
jgi:hypothetical protein